VIEPIVGFILCGVVMLATRVYLARFHVDVERQPEFEAWAEDRPLVVALRCRPDRSVEVLYRLREALGRGELFHSAGGFPWQHYVVTFAARRLEGGIVGLEVAHVRLARADEERPTLSGLLDLVGPQLRDETQEVWLSGRLRPAGPAGASTHRDRLGWTGRFDGAGDLDVAPMIGQPVWLTGPSLAA
jgi:hypothetical protein